MKLRLAGAQIPVTEDVAENEAAIGRAIDFAAKEKADILLTPEGSLSGYTAKFDADAVSAALERVTALAREARLGLALGTCFVEPEDGKCYNECRFYASDGTFLGFHAKTVLCGTLDAEPTGEINDYAVRPLRTFELAGVTVGALICNDLWANPTCTPMDDPHLSQQLARMGARVIFNPVNGGRGDTDWRNVVWNYHESNLRMRARAGKLWIVTVDNCHPPNLRCCVPSGVIDPDGNPVCRTKPHGEQMFAHTIELDAT
ncbi:MAG TPA: carbon-nitrogen hydrolase family protein [Planctomycetota bacterium]|nr:carbon-nitrogen hydrolase family protein [Planctomycetota bacterium]